MIKRAPALLLLFILAACQGDGGQQAAAPTTTPAPSTTVEPTTTTDVGLEGPPSEKVGQAFTTAWHVGDGSGETEMKVTVKRPITCGIKGYRLPNGSSTDQNKKQHLAPKGMRFCQVDFTLENTGKTRTWSAPSGFVYDNQG